ncbi:hypothetical protein CRE_07348 [Caenorhabditis remanei]|uniref:Uncharacterized protein n=1 Tax=Caenorhabditis remanei TaxID=31234 RepID=E3M2C9_CAERE|nr:hypothetical protein CRE_07348 [Caenorhabditis remanei]
MNADLAEMAEMNIELTDMLNDLTNSFDRMQEAFENSGDQWRTATLQHITQLTTEITRVRARRMRHSFEASLARQAADRRRRTSSDSSTDSDNSDIDLDFAYPIDLCQFTTTSTNDLKKEEDQSMEVGDTEENNSAAIFGDPEQRLGGHLFNYMFRRFFDNKKLLNHLIYEMKFFKRTGTPQVTDEGVDIDLDSSDDMSESEDDMTEITDISSDGTSDDDEMADQPDFRGVNAGRQRSPQPQNLRRNPACSSSRCRGRGGGGSWGPGRGRGRGRS